jgi:hypothetical protein
MWQTLTWGSVLGPGLVTRNPYAGMWLLPLLIVLQHDLFTAVVSGATVGIAHGSARAFGILRNRKHQNDSCAPILILASQWRWQFMDGLALLGIAGGLGAYTFSLLISHP